MAAPKVSVIVPVYNTEKYLKQCVLKCIQTFGCIGAESQNFCNSSTIFTFEFANAIQATFNTIDSCSGVCTIIIHIGTYRLGDILNFGCSKRKTCT